MFEHTSSPARAGFAGERIRTDLAPTSDSARGSLYGLPFWAAYVNQALVTTALALWYRYSDLVEVLGGTTMDLGWIVGVGTTGSLIARFLLGPWIDQYGPRRVWSLSCLALALSFFAHLGLSRCDGTAIYALRFIQFTAAAGVIGASTVLVSFHAPRERMAEIIACFGTSGFFGILVGTFFGDLLCGETASWDGVVRMCLASGLVCLASIPFVGIATARLKPPATCERPPLFALLRRYNPGPVLLVGVVGGAAIALPQTFIRNFATELGIAHISWFFLVVAVIGIVLRILTRRIAERLGTEFVLLVGLAFMVVTQFLFLFVSAEWHLVFPAVGHGVSQAVLYPMAAALVSCAFPQQYRGIGTTVALASFDVGQLIGAPAAGAVLHLSGALGLPGYPAIFVLMSLGLAVVTIGYGWTVRRRTRFLAWATRWETASVPDGEPERPIVTAASAAAGRVSTRSHLNPRSIAGSSRSSV